MKPNPTRRAFTLVELLAVMVLMSLLAAMVITATNGVIETARETRTKKIIAAIDSVIQEQYRSYKYRPLSVEIPETATAVSDPNTPANEIGFEVLASEAARVRLMMIRDLQRMELPDRLTDIADGPSSVARGRQPRHYRRLGRHSGRTQRQDATTNVCGQLVQRERQLRQRFGQRSGQIGRLSSTTPRSRESQFGCV